MLSPALAAHTGDCAGADISLSVPAFAKLTGSGPSANPTVAVRCCSPQRCLAFCWPVGCSAEPGSIPHLCPPAPDSPCRKSQISWEWTDCAPLLDGTIKMLVKPGGK